MLTAFTILTVVLAGLVCLTIGLAVLAIGIGTAYGWWCDHVSRKNLPKSMMLTRTPNGLWHAHGPRIQPRKRPRH